MYKWDAVNLGTSCFCKFVRKDTWILEEKFTYNRILPWHATYVKGNEIDLKYVGLHQCMFELSC